MIEVGVKYKMIPNSFPASELISPTIADVFR